MRIGGRDGRVDGARSLASGRDFGKREVLLAATVGAYTARNV